MNVSDAKSLLLDHSIVDELDEQALQRLVKALVPVKLAPGETLFRAGDPGDRMYLVLNGLLAVMSHDSDGASRHVARLGSGSCVGEMALLTGAPRSYTVCAESWSKLMGLECTDFHLACQDEPSLRQILGKLLVQRKTASHRVVMNFFTGLNAELLNEVQAACTWMRLRRGETLFRQGQVGDALYFVVSGRLQVLIKDESGTERCVAHVGRGQPVGEMALLANEPRSATVQALRESDLIRLGKNGFRAILEREPQAVLPILQTLVTRLRATTSGAVKREHLSTIALVPISSGIPSNGDHLVRELRRSGSVAQVSSEWFDSIHGAASSHEADHGPRSFQLRQWLNRLEEEHTYVVYEAHSEIDAWTRRCLLQADRVLLVADAQASPELGPIDRWLQEARLKVPCELVLLHKQGAETPTTTHEWLRHRSLERHHHVRLDHHGDILRLARFIAGHSVGLVLGSGGARGFAHLGVFKALQECGIPVDFTGGSSMGALVATVIAADLEFGEMVETMRRILVVGPRAYEYTLPMVAVMNVDRAEQRIRDAFGERRIEDLWVNYFCISTNITQGCMNIHRTGALWRAVRASVSIPGLLPPVFSHGDLLVDGALLNNIPTNVMRDLCPGPIIACDVSRAMALRVSEDLDACPPPGRLLWNRLLPWKKTDSIPNIASILTRSVDCGSDLNKELNRELAHLFLTPPVESYALLDLGRIDEIVEVGYRYTSEILEKADLAPFHL